jgi:hypothetical protein
LRPDRVPHNRIFQLKYLRLQGISRLVDPSEPSVIRRESREKEFVIDPIFLLNFERAVIVNMMLLES